MSSPSLADDSFDVLVAGGGPAGAAAATISAQHGHRVLLVERSPRPQFKVGESLMPATYWTFERLGVLERMRESHFPQKHSVQFFAPGGRAATPFYFRDNDPHESSQTWQVLRSEFDQMLLANAVEKGVEVRRGVRLEELTLEGGRVVGASLRTLDGENLRVRSRVLVDATGQSAFVARKLGLLDVESHLKNVAFYTHFEAARRDHGIDAGATLILHTDSRRSWFWFIPLPDDRVSVGVVGPVEHLIGGRAGDPQQVFDEEILQCAELQTRLRTARQAAPMRAIRDFSYRSRELAGDGWVLVGDAYGFIDPIYSTGVFLALKSGELAADAIHRALVDEDCSAERLGAFRSEYDAGLEALRQLVYAYYDPQFSFSDFLRRHPECRSGLVHMLVGNVFREPVDHVLRALDETLAAASPGAAS